MGKSSAAKVIDLEAFRQQRVAKERGDARGHSSDSAPASAPMMMPVWFCWVPVWAPVLA